jgi:hypothetical protein
LGKQKMVEGLRHDQHEGPESMSSMSPEDVSQLHASAEAAMKAKAAEAGASTNQLRYSEGPNAEGTETFTPAEVAGLHAASAEAANETMNPPDGEVPKES